MRLRDPDAVAKILQDWGIIDDGVQETPYHFLELDGPPLKTIRLVGASRWLSLLQAKHRPSGETEQQQLVAAKPIAQAQTGSDLAVQNFLQALMSPAPPFPVQAANQNLYTQKREAEKWFGKNGVSRSQMLCLIKSGELGLLKVKTKNGEDKMIGPPST